MQWSHGGFQLEGGLLERLEPPALYPVPLCDLNNAASLTILKHLSDLCVSAASFVSGSFIQCSQLKTRTPQNEAV